MSSSVENKPRWIVELEKDIENVTPMIVVGKALKIYYGKDNPNTRKIHVRALVDGDQVVVRSWLRHKQRWEYTVESIVYFAVQNKVGALKKSRS